MFSNDWMRPGDFIYLNISAYYTFNNALTSRYRVLFEPTTGLYHLAKVMHKTGHHTERGVESSMLRQRGGHIWLSGHTRYMTFIVRVRETVRGFAQTKLTITLQLGTGNGPSGRLFQQYTWESLGFGPDRWAER